MALVGFLAILTPFGVVGGAETNKLTKAEVSQLLPKGWDLPNPSELQQEIANRKRLVEAGERAFAALDEVLAETDNYLVASRILSIFCDAKGDKSIPIKATKELLLRSRGKTWGESNIRANAAATLGKIGGPNDTDVLVPLLDDDYETVAINAFQAIAKIGTETAIPQIEHFLTARRSKLTPDEAAKDMRCIEASNAVEILNKRRLK